MRTTLAIATVVVLTFMATAWAAECKPTGPILKKAVDYWVDAVSHTIIGRVVEHSEPPAQSITFVWCPPQKCTMCTGMWAALIEREYVTFTPTCKPIPITFPDDLAAANLLEEEWHCRIINKLGSKFLAIPLNIWLCEGDTPYDLLGNPLCITNPTLQVPPALLTDQTLTYEVKYWVPCGGCGSSGMPLMVPVEYRAAVWDPSCGTWDNAGGDYWVMTKVPQFVLK